VSGAGAGASTDVGVAGDDPAEGGAPPPPVVRRSATSLLTWGTVALVLIIVIVLVVVKVTGTSATPTPATGPSPSAAPPAVVHEVTNVPEAVFDAVGVTSTDAAVTPPTLLKGQRRLEEAGRPEVVFVGDEFCPYCAAERWAVVVALARFGTWSGLDAMESGSDEAFPATPTFTFVSSRLTSRYVSAKLIEHYGDQQNSAGTSYTVLERLPGTVKALMAQYDRSTPGTPGGLVPFLDIANRAVLSGGAYSPAVLQQLTSTDIAGGLTDAKDPATEAIVATANYLSAVICSVDGQQPVSVCTGPGVVTAAAALQLAP
jgi:hypothetical protein